MTYIDEIYKENETSNIVVWVETNEKTMQHYNHNYICLDLDNTSIDNLIDNINYELKWRFKIQLNNNNIAEIKKIYNDYHAGNLI